MREIITSIRVVVMIRTAGAVRKRLKNKVQIMRTPVELALVPEIARCPAISVAFSIKTGFGKQFFMSIYTDKKCRLGILI